MKTHKHHFLEARGPAVQCKGFARELHTNFMLLWLMASATWAIYLTRIYEPSVASGSSYWVLLIGYPASVAVLGAIVVVARWDGWFGRLCFWTWIVPSLFMGVIVASYFVTVAHIGKNTSPLETLQRHAVPATLFDYLTTVLYLLAFISALGVFLECVSRVGGFLWNWFNARRK